MSLSTLRPARLGRTALAVLGLIAGLSSSAMGQAGRADQVFVRHPRKASQVETHSGKVKESSLSEVVLDVSGETKTFPSERVVRVQLNSVSDWYREGALLYSRGDFENSAASFAQAADDVSFSETERASARLWVARAMHARAAADPSYYKDAVENAQQVVADFPNSRLVPAARMLQARATHLSGDAAGARDMYKGVYQEVTGSTAATGYSLETCYRAAQLAGYAALDAGDTLGAREILGAIAAELQTVLADLDPDSPALSELQLAYANAQLVEGHALLAASKASEARSFFESQLAKAESEGPSALRFGAMEGLGQALKASGDLVAAQFQLAKVAALDPTDRDRSARALLALAECMLAGSSSDAKEQATMRLTTIQQRYGDTPTASKASALLASL